MITIGYSTRKHNPEYQEYLQKTCMYKEVQIIEKINNGEKNLSEVYNEIISESNFDIIVLCHDDIYFDTNNWVSKLVKQFDKNPDYGIFGMAGTTEMPTSGMWWEDRSKMYGIVNHESEGKKWESKYSDSLGNDVKEVVEKHKDLQGVSIINTKLKINGTKLSYPGGLLFTHFGLTGPSVLHASEDIYQHLLDGKVFVSFSLIDQSREGFIKLLEQAKTTKTPILKLLESMTTKKLASKVLTLVGIENKNVNEISKKELNSITEYLTNFTVEIEGSIS